MTCAAGQHARHLHARACCGGPRNLDQAIRCKILTAFYTLFKPVYGPAHGVHLTHGPCAVGETDWLAKTSRDSSGPHVAPGLTDVEMHAIEALQLEGDVRVDDIGNGTK